MKTWTDDMGEISGFGGSYEAACRAMVLGGVRWLEEHPAAEPQFKGFKNVFGLITENNDDAKALSDAILEAEVVADSGRRVPAREECTGAMHHAAVLKCLAVKRHGWERFCELQREAAKEG